MKAKVTLVIPDTHFQAKLGEKLNLPSAYCHDADALSLMLQVANDLEPDNIIHIGDICEMATLSPWSKGTPLEGQVKGSDGEHYKSIWSDQMNMVTTFWQYLHKKFPKATKHQLEGNHDFWAKVEFEKMPIAQFPELSFRNLPVWKDCNIQYYNYDGSEDKQSWIDVGKVRVLHGYKNVSVQRMRLEHDNVVYGHQHKILYNAWDANSREKRRAWCIGCLTKLNPDYNSRAGQQNGWAQAFGVIYTLPDEQFKVEVVEIDKGTIVSFNGKTYTAKPLEEIDKSLAIF